MKFLYLTMWEISESSGVYKKIIAQQKALTRLGHVCDVLFVNSTNNAVLKRIDSQDKISFNDKESSLSLVCEYDYCYVRFELLRHKFYRNVLNACKRKEVPMILEIPTYPPYEESIARVKAKLKSKNYLGALKTRLGVCIVKHDLNKQIKMSRLVCNNGDGTIFPQTQTIRIENGIDFEQNPYIKRTKKNDGVNIIAVSNFAVWNGYDLAIEGLAEYKKRTGRNDIHISFVGDKKKASDLIELTEKYQLNDCIKFTGLLGGEELDFEYANANVALGALGDHRRKAFTNSSLKAKEYAARGLVMILSESEGIEPEIKDNSFLVPAEEKPVNFESFMTWYSGINSEVLSEDIYKFAEKNYSWDIQMRRIIDVLQFREN